MTTKEKVLLQNKLDSSDKLALLSIDDICLLINRTVKARSWNGKVNLKKAQTAQSLISKLGIGWTAIDSPDFPPMLREMKDPPYMIFYRGNLDALNAPCVSVVGTRRATAGAMKAAIQFGFDSASAGMTVVSGFAFGIDIASHRGVLKAEKGSACAVLPCGIDTIAPASHTKYAASILQRGGLILSEYIPGTPAAPFRFVQRNRLIAALSPATVVIQAPSGSGAMITADLALDYNRELFFHEVAVSEVSAALEKASRQLLAKKELLEGKKKQGRSAFQYVEDGAPLIKDFSDFQNKKGYCPQKGPELF